MKKIIAFPLFLIPWFLSLLIIKVEVTYFNSLNLPFFMPSLKQLFLLLSVIYISIAISIYIIYIKYKEKTRIYYESIITNYVLNQLSIVTLFAIKNHLLFFLNSMALLVSTLWLYKEIKKLDKKTSLFIIIYIIWCFFQTIASILIYLTNP
jgi:tryptophan-rich sensory protein